jgi:hypothetical protein
MARPIIIDLNYHIASQLKIHLYFDSHWILISEFTFDSFIIPIDRTIKSSSTSIDISIYIIICLLIIMIILILPIIIILCTRNLFQNKKRYFTPINSSISTTSSEIDTSSSHHRYATIGPIQPNGSIASSPYAKLIPTTNLVRSPSIIQENHIESICGNSAYGTQRSFSFHFNENLFISSQKIQIIRRVENRHQMIRGGEVNIILRFRKRSSPFGT